MDPRRVLTASLGVADRAVTAVVNRSVRMVLDRVDVTQYVLDRVDLARILAAVDPDPLAERIDVDAFLDRVDLIGITQRVLDAMNLPEIIRESSAGVASEGVIGLRMQTLSADARLDRLMNRVLARRARADGGSGDESR